MSKINFNYLNKKVKCGLAMSLMAVSLTACANNNDKEENYAVVTEIDDKIELYPGSAVWAKSLDFSDKELKKIKNRIGTDRIVLEVLDESDYINGLELVVKDLNGNIIDNFVTDNKEHIVTNLKDGQTYVIEEKNVLGNYDFESKGYKFTAPSKNQEFSTRDYYITNYLTIYKESKEYKQRENNGECIVTVFERGEGRVPGVTIEVSDLKGQVIERFTSTEMSHNITNLKDGQYKVKVVSGIPFGYKIDAIEGLVEKENQNLEENECIITIENGKYPSKYYVGPIFYLTDTLAKIKEYPKRLLKTR